MTLRLRVMVRRRSQLPVLPAANPPIVQQRDDIGANGRDRAMSSYATRVCWHFMRNNYGAAYVVAEAKNTAAAVSKFACWRMPGANASSGGAVFGQSEHCGRDPAGICGPGPCSARLSGG